MDKLRLAKEVDGLADSTSTTGLVLRQCNDLMGFRETLLARSLQQQREERSRHTAQAEWSEEECQSLYRQLQEERLKHEEVRNTLTEEREKVQLAETEVKVARKQLEREQAAFEQAFGLLKTRALADSSKSESFLAKCSALETLCAKKDEEVAAKTHENGQLRVVIEELKLAHKLDVQELNVRLQQEVYMANKLGVGEDGSHRLLSRDNIAAGSRVKRKHKQ